MQEKVPRKVARNWVKMYSGNIAGTKQETMQEGLARKLVVNNARNVAGKIWTVCKIGNINNKELGRLKNTQ